MNDAFNKLLDLTANDALEIARLRVLVHELQHELEQARSAPCVYLLSHYGEHGSEDVVSTLDRAHLPALLRQRWGDWSHLPEAQGRLAELLERPDAELAGPTASNPHNLTRGWGGVQLHVVRIEGACQPSGGAG
jgi:hypothetical protein